MAVQCAWLYKGDLCASHVGLEPNHEAPWPVGLVIREQLIQLPSKDKAKVKVTVENITDSDIVLCSRTTLEWMPSQ